MWMADLPSALSKLCRSVLPSMATTCPAVTSCSAVIQDEQAPLELGGLERREDGVEAVVRGDAAGQVEEPGQPGPLLAAPCGDGDEVVGPGDDGTEGDGHDVDERIGDLAAARVGQAGEVLLDPGGELVGHGGRTSENVGDSVAGPVAGITENRHVSIIPNYPSWRNRPANLSSNGSSASPRTSCQPVGRPWRPWSPPRSAPSGRTCHPRPRMAGTVCQAPDQAGLASSPQRRVEVHRRHGRGRRLLGKPAEEATDRRPRLDRRPRVPHPDGRRLLGGRAVPVRASHTGSTLRRSQNAWRSRSARAPRRDPAVRPVVILADRGFGRAELAAFCQEQRFRYVIRIQPDVTVRARLPRGAAGLPGREGGGQGAQGGRLPRGRAVTQNVVSAGGTTCRRSGTSPGS